MRECADWDQQQQQRCCTARAQQGTDSSAMPSASLPKNRDPLLFATPLPKIDDDDETKTTTPSLNDDEPATAVVN